MVNKESHPIPELLLQLVEVDKATYYDIGWESYTHCTAPERNSAIEDFAESARNMDIHMVMEAEIGRN